MFVSYESRRLLYSCAAMFVCVLCSNRTREQMGALLIPRIGKEPGRWHTVPKQRRTARAEEGNKIFSARKRVRAKGLETMRHSRTPVRTEMTTGGGPDVTRRENPSACQLTATSVYHPFFFGPWGNARE